MGLCDHFLVMEMTKLIDKVTSHRSKIEKGCSYYRSFALMFLGGLPLSLECSCLFGFYARRIHLLLQSHQEEQA